MSDESAADLVPVYVWQIPVRVTHWLIALSLFVLSVTGLYIDRPFMTVPALPGSGSSWAG
jgi:Ni/Fe-hydrogenase 1 B-type cytochrome subunit